MPPASAPADVPLSSLRLGKMLGRGGEGEVFEVGSRPGQLLKKYLRPGIDGARLRALTGFPGSLSVHDRTVLLRHSSWPLACVTDGPAVVGFLMSRAPASFTGQTAAGPRLRELQYLLYPPKPLWGDIAPPGPDGRVQVARAFVSLMRTLQDHSVVLGDISMANLLWSPGQPAEIFLIDCDGALLPGYPAARPVVQTPEWDDPGMPATGPDLDTDRYKAALVIGRILAADAAVRPGQPLTPVPGIPPAIADPLRACFAAAQGAHGTRPDLSRWTQALSGREMLTVVPHTPLPPPPGMPRAAVDRPGPREAIQLRPPPGQP